MPQRGRMAQTVLIYSGGLDSTVLLYHLMDQGDEVAALSVNYGQRHVRELRSAAEIIGQLGVLHRTLDVSSLAMLWPGSSLTSNELAVPQGHYAEETMKSTVVPNRNMLLLALAAGWAMSLKASAVAYAAHGGDHAIYPDCRPEFAEAMKRAIALADWHRVELIQPFISWTKSEIIRRGADLGVPFARTWSCYLGGERHCGRCGTCIERREAFYLADLMDPTLYAEDAPPQDALIAQGWRLS